MNQPYRPTVPLVLLLAACLGASLAACAGPARVDYARPHPALFQQGSVNIQVVRHSTSIELTNTTARAFGPSTLWLNARYSRPIDDLKVGETVHLPMNEFRDEHHDAFRGGGFFATENPDRLVLAQIETKKDDGTPELIGLVVVGGDPE